MKIFKRAAAAVCAVLTAATAVPAMAGAVTVTDVSGLKEELTAAYQNGECDWDLNLDGVIDPLDSLCVLNRYMELSTDSLRDTYQDSQSSDMIGWNEYAFTDEMRAKVDKCGDIDGDGFVSIKDQYWMLDVIYGAKETGDVNTDGMVDARDASDVLAVYVNNSVSIQSDYVTEKNMEYLGDLNGDGKTDASDASAVLRVYSENSVK